MNEGGSLSESGDQPVGAEPAELGIEEVRELVAEGREQGYLAGERIHDVLQEVDLVPDQIDNIFILLNDLGIDIVDGDEPAPPAPGAKVEDEVVAKLDLSVKTPTNDPVRMYLKEIGKVRCSPPKKRSRWPSASSAATWRPSAGSSRPTCASSSRSPSATSAAACTSSTSSRRATWA